MLSDLLKLIPLPYRILAAVLFAVVSYGGVGLYAYHLGSEHAQTVVQKYEVKQQAVATNVAKADQTNGDKVTIKYVDRVKTVTKLQTEYVDTAKDLVPAQNDLSNGWIYTHNQAALNAEIDKQLAADPTPSGVKDNVALETITENYANCEIDREQLRQLQQSILDHNKAIEDAKKSE